MEVEDHYQKDPPHKTLGYINDVRSPVDKSWAEVSPSCTNYYTSVSQLVVKEKLVLHNAPFPAKIHY